MALQVDAVSLRPATGLEQLLSMFQPWSVLLGSQAPFEISQYHQTISRACSNVLRNLEVRHHVWVQAQTLRSELVLSAHAGPVYGLAFAHEYAELFATSALGEIRVWHTATGRELLRISVPNLHCKCLAFMPVCLFPFCYLPLRCSRFCFYRRP